MPVWLALLTAKLELVFGDRKIEVDVSGGCRDCFLLAELLCNAWFGEGIVLRA